nr:hypothetical protein [Tanacetum cinerariifolium]
MDACVAFTRRVEHLEFDKAAQALEITKLKRRVKKPKKRNNVRKLNFRRLQRVGTSQRVETSNETVLDDVSNQGRMIAEMDQDDVVVLVDDKEEDRKVVDVVKDVEEAKVDESAQDQGRQAESQAKIFKIDMDHANKSKDKGKGILLEEPKPLKKKQQIEQDEQYARELHTELNKNIDWDEVIDHNVTGFKMDYFKGMSYDDIPPIFEAKFNSNVAFLLKTKEHIEEDENKALQKFNKTPVERTVHGPAKVKGWKLLESCGMKIITFTST